MSFWDDIVNAAGSAASSVGNAVGGAAGYVWDGITHPVDAVKDTLAQIEAAQHGFNSVDAYNAYLAKQPQPSTYYGTGNPSADAALNVIGGIGVHTGTSGTGLGMGPTAGSTIPHTAEQVTNAVTQGQNAYNNPAPAPTDSQVNPQMGDAYKNAMGPASNNLGYNAQDGQTANGLTWSSYAGKWVSPAEYVAIQSQMKSSLPAPTTPAGSSNADLRVGDHRTYNGVYQTWNGTSWNNGNSAAPPSDPAGSVPLQQSQAPQVSTATQNPLMTPEQWAAQRDAIMHRYYNDMSYSPEQKEADLAKLGPQPTNNPTNPALPSTPSNPNSVPTPLPAQTPTNPAPNNPAAGATTGAAGAAVGGAGVDVLAALKAMGIDGNTAALLAATGGSALTSWLAAHEQSKAAADAAAAQQAGYDKALAQQQGQFDTTNKINAGIYADQQANLKPWMDAGKTALTGLQNFDQNNPTIPNATFDYNNWKDPGYQFRLDKGLDALQNSAAAKGGLFSGNTMKAITDYGQDAASQEYQNAFSRFTTKNTNDFNQTMTQRGMKLNELQSLAGVGQSATQQTNNAGSTYANNTQQAGQQNSAAAGGLLTGSANAMAGGITGQGSANASGYLGMGNAFTSGLQQYYNQQNANATNAMMMSILNRGK